MSKQRHKPNPVVQMQIATMIQVVKDVRVNTRLMREWGQAQNASRAYRRALGYIRDIRRLRVEA